MNKAQQVRRVTIFTTFVIFLAAIGFVFKIWEFVRSLGDADAVGFAIVPLSSYFLTGFGFLLLLIWAAGRGMFRDVEAPKWRMMEMEHQYALEEDEDESDDWCLSEEDET